MPNVSPKHKDRMFGLCDQVKTWSECPAGRQHACVLALKGKYVVATGFNGVSEGVCGLNGCCSTLSTDVIRRSCPAVHAEVNAVKNCPIPTRGLVAFVSKRPCSTCMHYLKDNGIAQLYWREDEATQGEVYDLQNWSEHDG